MKDDAVILAENLGIMFEQVFLTDTCDALAKGLFVDPGHDKIKTLTLANMKARLRMTALYAVANQNRYLVVGTGNKSELMVGYFTKGGDGQVDLEPLGNYYKGEVYKMAELMSEIPEGPKTKAPSADLYEGQTDEQELGMSYDELDDMLRKIENGTFSILDPKYQKVQKMIDSAKHKNEVPPRYIR